MDQDFAILTPEKTIITYRLAGLGNRVLAHVLDLLAVGVLYGLVTVTIVFTIGRFDENISTGLISFLALFIVFGYFIILEGFWNGQTLGKKAAGVRVRMADGTPITFAAAAGRNFLRPADMLPGLYMVGLVAMFTNPRSQRLGDLVANTIVVVEETAPTVQIGAPHAAGIHPLEIHLDDLRGMTISEYNALRRYCDRFPELSPETQVKLTETVWLPVATRLQIPAIEGIHPIYLAEAAVMKFGRQHGIL